MESTTKMRLFRRPRAFAGVSMSKSEAAVARATGVKSESYFVPRCSLLVCRYSLFVSIRSIRGLYSLGSEAKGDTLGCNGGL